LVSTKTLDRYMPITPIKKMVRPPKNQTETIREVQPLMVMPENIFLLKR